MRSTSYYNSKPRTRGFTLVEVLILAPIVILAISAFIGIIVSIVGDVIQSRNASQQVYDSSSALDIIEQDLRLTSSFSVTTSELPSPQGSNNNFNGTAAFTSPNNALILETAATDSNPAASDRRVVYYADQPNSCANQSSFPIDANPDVIYNRVFTVTNIYFVKDGSLWKRTFVPNFNTDTSDPDADTVCANPSYPPWQRNSCSPGQTASRCQTQDVKLVDNITEFDVEYIHSDDPNLDDPDTDNSPSSAPEAEAINVTITTNQQSVGEANETVMSRRMARGNTTTPVQWQPLDLQAGWGRFSTEYGDPSFTITNTGVVYLRGLISGGTTTGGTVIATLPPGYRPSNRIIFPTSTSGNVSGRIDVDESGSVIFRGGSNDWTSLDDIHFLADNSPYTLSGLTFDASNGWENYYSSSLPLEAGVDGAGRTHVRGLIRPGDTSVNTTIATFPSNMQSENKQYFFTGYAAGADYAYYGVQSTYGLRYRRPTGISWLSVQSMFYPASFTGWTNLNLDSAWSDYGGSYTTAQYTKAKDGVVTIKGLVQGGSTASNTVIATLPPEYRPGSVRSFNLPSYFADHARINVYPNGEIRVRHLTSSTWVSLSGITFIAGY